MAADVADDALDPDDVAPLFAALHASSGDARATILEALVRLPLGADDLRRLGVAPPAHPPPLRPPWADAELPGFTTYSASASADLDARLETIEPPEDSLRPTSPALEDEIAPAAVSRWFASSVGDYADVGLGNLIVGWVGAYEGSFRPDLDGLFAQYRRAALAECAAWEGDRRPGTWFLRNPDFEDWAGYRSLCWQIGWTVSRGGLRGLVPGLAGPLAAEDETERTIAALLIADAADYLLTAEPPIFGGGYGPPPRPPAGAADPATLPHLLRDAARAGVVPARAAPAPAAPVPPAEPAPEPPFTPTPAPAPPLPPPAPPEPEFDDLDVSPTTPASPPAPASPRAPRRRGPLGAALFALALLGGAAIAKWVFGWFTTTIDTDAPGLDDVQCTVFAPPVTSPGGTILVQVFAHMPKEADDARAIATELDVGAVRRGFRSLDASVPLGARLDFELRMAGLEIDDPVASLTWHGRTEAVQFGVHIPSGAPVGTVIGTVSIGRDGAPLGHVKFTLAIEADGVGSAAEPQGLEARRYRFAFVSYATQDRDEVLRRVQMLPLTGVHYFQDVLDLQPGEVWSSRLEQAIREADVFLLFWSSRAKESTWVRKEVDFALACQAGDEQSPPEIRPVIIEGPPVIAPWDDLAHLHFNDRVLYFMGRPR
jgi:hypothetical protein